jgi:hypothetical protein
MEFFFASLKSLKKGVGSISQRYGSGHPDPDPHQNVTDPQHCLSTCIQYTYSHREGAEGGRVEPERRLRGNSSQSWIENTNMTDCTSSL